MSQTLIQGLERSKPRDFIADWGHNFTAGRPDLHTLTMFEPSPKASQLKREHYQRMIYKRFAAKRGSVAAIEEEIARSTYLLNLKEDWDEMGASIIPSDVYYGAIKLLRTQADFINSQMGEELIAPEINPCADGSVDLSWQTEHTSLLINVKLKDGKLIASYFGESGFNQIKGIILVDVFEEALATWMKKLTQREYLVMTIGSVGR